MIKKTDGKFNISVRFMGSFRCSCDGEALTFAENSTVKANQLFMLLLFFSREGVSKDTVKEFLYHDSDADFSSSLKSLLSRLRKTLAEQFELDGENAVSLQYGRLILGESFSVSSDVDVFREYIRQAREADNDDAEAKLLSKACEAYSGELLPMLSNELWVICENAALQQDHFYAVSALNAYYNSKADYEAAYNVCKRAMTFFPYEETWSVGCISALQAMGKYAMAMREYEQITNLLFDELGVYPSERLIESMQKISDCVASGEDNDAVRRALSMPEKEAVEGALYCSYPNFLEHIKMLWRLKKRYSIDTTIVLITVTDKKGRELENEERILNAMTVLRMSLFRTLRSTDIFTRFGKTQILLLLWGMPPENVEIPMKRVLERISEEDESGSCFIKYKVVMNEDSLRLTSQYKNTGSW